MNRVPPRVADFRHIGTEVWLRRGMSPKVCAFGRGEDRSCSLSQDILSLDPLDHAGMMGFSTLDSQAIGPCFFATPGSWLGNMINDFKSRFWR